MITPLLFVFLGLQQSSQPATGQAVEMTYQRVGQLQAEVSGLRGQIGELRGQVTDVNRQIGEFAKSTDQIRTEIQRVPTCAAEAKWIPLSSTRVADAQTPVALSLFSTISQPADGCLSAEVVVTASYYDPKGSLVCTGSLMVPQTTHVQNHLFEFRPLPLEFFMKWRDGPTWDRSNYHLLRCLDYDGIENRDPASQSSSVRLFATVLPKRGGVVTVDTTLTLPEPPKPARPNVLPQPRPF